MKRKTWIFREAKRNPTGALKDAAMDYLFKAILQEPCARGGE